MRAATTRIFLGLLFFSLVTGAIFLSVNDKGALVLVFNENYNSFLNTIFIWITFLGDGMMIGVLIVIFLFFRYYHAAVVALMGAVQLVLVQGLKKGVFGPLPRPAAFFEGETDISFIEGIEINYLFSFPSGHTTTAFSIAFILILLLKPRWGTSVVLFLIALVVGLSRVYLAQHFLEDVLGGAALGVIDAWLAYAIGEYIRSRNPQRRFFHFSLLKGSP